MKRISFILSLLLFFTTACVAVQSSNPKREFRGAWMHTIFQSQYTKMSPSECQQYLRDQLDKLQAAGCNAVVFQVRPQADALYPSQLEPWSRHLTGTAGKAPNPYWDPLKFMIEECHARGMELHAWLNPYRVTTSANEKLPKNHIYYKHRERFVTYGGKLYFDPGLPENRDFIISVVKDIITRYDVDAIHMDDYFYPYPVNDKKTGKRVDFPDDKSYKFYGRGLDRDTWRRYNVDGLIEGIHNMIDSVRPYVRLGISPFGIWRNKKSDPTGSETNGLQNYDDLYANVTYWTKAGWVDYMVPQLYWSFGNKRAPANVLAHWWNDNANGRDLYIGQDIRTTMDTPDGQDSTELAHKIALTRELPNIQGSCWWPGYDITSNYHGVADSLSSNQHSTIALVPAYPWLSKINPYEVSALQASQNADGISLNWQITPSLEPMCQGHKFVVYRFNKGEKKNLDNAAAIREVTYSTTYKEKEKLPKGTYTYVVTSLNRVNNESPKGTEIKVKIK
jgi:uncharacterized lipoprotein YddW (UPF0748 family)